MSDNEQSVHQMGATLTEQSTKQPQAPQLDDSLVQVVTELLNNNIGNRLTRELAIGILNVFSTSQVQLATEALNGNNKRTS